MPSKRHSGEHRGITSIAFQFPHPDPVFRFQIDLPVDWRQHAPDSASWAGLATTLAAFSPPAGGLQLSVAFARREVQTLPADLARLTLAALGHSVLSLTPSTNGCCTLSILPPHPDHRLTRWLVLNDRCWLLSATAPPAQLEASRSLIDLIINSFSLSTRSPVPSPAPWFHSSTRFAFRFQLLPGWQRLGRIRRPQGFFQSTVAGPAGELTILWADNPKRELWEILALPKPASVQHLPPSQDFTTRFVATAESWLGLGFAGPDGSLLIVAAGLDAPANSLTAAAARAALQLAASSVARFIPESPQFYSRLASALLRVAPRWFAIVNEDFADRIHGLAVATESLTLTQTGILLAEFLPQSEILPRLWGRQAIVLAAASCSIQELAHHWRVLLILQDGDRLATFPAHRPDLLATFLATAPADSRRAFLGPAQELWIESENAKAILRVSAEDCSAFDF